MEQQGRTLARCVDMFVLPAAIIYAGTGQKLDPALEILDEERSLLHYYWRQLLNLRPSLEADLQDLDMQGLTLVNVAWLRGRTEVNAGDARSISLDIVEWLEKDLQTANVRLHRCRRTDRGFNNVVTGRYLCPVFLDYSDQTVREALLRVNSLKTGGGPPSFLFDLEKFDAAAPWGSFLRGPLVVLAWFRIFDLWSRQEGAARRSHVRISVARSHGMTQVTTGSIIYAATMVHFALSTTHSIQEKHSEVRTLHEILVELVNDPAQLDFVEGLLRWWNRYEV